MTRKSSKLKALPQLMSKLRLSNKEEDSLRRKWQRLDLLFLLQVILAIEQCVLAMANSSKQKLPLGDTVREQKRTRVCLFLNL